MNNLSDLSPDIKISVRQTFNLDSDMEIEGFSNKNNYVPKIDNHYNYVSKKYGNDHVSQIITFGTMAAKAVVRDVGRVLNFPYGFVDQIAKLIPIDLAKAMTLDRALAEEKMLKKRYKSEDDVKLLIDLAKKLFDFFN